MTKPSDPGRRPAASLRAALIRKPHRALAAHRKRISNEQYVGEAIYQRGLYYQSRRQFSKAINEYRRLLAAFPLHEHADHARDQIVVIGHADVLLGRTGVYPSDAKPKLWFAFRNTDKVEFTARRFDLKRFITTCVTEAAWWEIEDLGASLFPHDRFRSMRRDETSPKLTEYEGPVAATWTQTVPRSDLMVTQTTLAPLSQAGAYVVEARLSGRTESSRGLVIVTDAAIVEKSLSGKNLLWVVNPRPASRLRVRRFLIHSLPTQHRYAIPPHTSTRTTDGQGLIEFVPAKSSETFALLYTEGGGIAWCGLPAAGDSESAGRSASDVRSHRSTALPARFDGPVSNLGPQSGRFALSARPIGRKSRVDLERSTETSQSTRSN